MKRITAELALTFHNSAFWCEIHTEIRQKQALSKQLGSSEAAHIRKFIVHG